MSTYILKDLLILYFCASLLVAVCVLVDYWKIGFVVQDGSVLKWRTVQCTYVLYVNYTLRFSVIHLGLSTCLWFETELIHNKVFKLQMFHIFYKLYFGLG